MKLFRVDASRTGYDQYNAFIIWAYTEEEARDIAIKTAGEWSNFIEGAEVQELTPPEKPNVELGSFNAG